MQSQRFPPPVFDILNLVPAEGGAQWRSVGNVTKGSAVLDAVLWPSTGKPTLMGPRPFGQPRFRVVTAYAAPFVMAATRLRNGSCLTGVPCLQVRLSPVISSRFKGIAGTDMELRLGRTEDAKTTSCARMLCA